MRITQSDRRFIWAAVAFTAISAARLVADETKADPLGSWNDGAAKLAIMSFVENVTNENSADFVPAADRIAVFDNDGTLWPENPLPFQLMFAIDELKRSARTVSRVEAERRDSGCTDRRCCDIEKRPQAFATRDTRRDSRRYDDRRVRRAHAQLDRFGEASSI